MVRYASVDEVNAALVELEEHDRIVSTDKASSEKHSDTEKPLSRTTSTTTVGNRQNNDNGAEENGVQDDVNDGEHDSGSDVIDEEGHDDEELDEENHDDGCGSEDDEEDDDVPASDDEDEVHVRQKVTEVDPLEEADFDQELKAVVQARVHLIYHVYLLLIHFLQSFDSLPIHTDSEPSYSENKFSQSCSI